MKIDNYEVRVECEGENIPEYGAEVDGKEVSCWIPSETGKAFRIVIKDHAQVSAARVDIHLDGHLAVSILLKMGAPGLKLETFGNGNGQHCIVHFSDVKMTDDEQDAGEITKDLGVIKVELRYVVDLGLSPDQVPTPGKTLEAITAHEKSKKMASHCIAMGKPKGSQAPPVYSHTRLLDITPRAKFVFRYRRRDILMANEIMPADPVPMAVQPTPPPRPSSVKKEKKPSQKPSVKLSNPTSSSSKKRKQPLQDNHNIEIIDLSDEEFRSSVVVKREKKRAKREDIEVIDLT